MRMKKIYCAFLFGVLCMLFLQPVSNLPGTRLQSRSPGLNCYNCYVCMTPYRSINGGWWPTFYYWEDVWIAGNEKKGTLYFYERPSPDETELGPPLYIYESTGEPDPPEKAMFLPAGTYLVLIKGECFHAYKHTCRDDMYFYTDDGTGAQKMSAELTTDKPKYGGEEITAVLHLQITDEETGEYIKVDTIFGSIQLPDGTQKTLEKETWEEDWGWNYFEKRYEYKWDFTNDSDKCSDPKEGFYEAEVYVKKQYYQDVKAKTEFGVCYHSVIDLEFDKPVPEYSIAEPVEMTATVTDKYGNPLSVNLESMLMLPNGFVVTNITWNPTERPGVYTSVYYPMEEGEYDIVLEAVGDTKCYLEEVTSTFYVNCDEAIIDARILNGFIDEPMTFILQICDEDCNPLVNAEIISFLELPDDTQTRVTWIEQEDGIYIAEYTPSLPGSYSLLADILVISESGCFTKSFEEHFDVFERLPDLLIRNEDITVYPDPVIGKEVSISVIVQNRGYADAERFYVLVIVTGKDSDRVLMENRYVSSLAAGSSITLTFTWNVKYSYVYYIFAIADAGEFKDEVFI
jgi:hypothetical protein